MLTAATAVVTGLKAIKRHNNTFRMDIIQSPLLIFSGTEEPVETGPGKNISILHRASAARARP
jgi:hypothetical protein